MQDLEIFGDSSMVKHLHQLHIVLSLFAAQVRAQQNNPFLQVQKKIIIKNEIPLNE
jgi:hypothetical protein